jgi:hypothetical protein
LAYMGVVTFLRAETEEEQWGGAMAIGIMNFVVTSYVISHYENMFIVFLFSAAVLTLHKSQQARLGLQGVTSGGRMPSRALVPQSA